MISRMSWRRRTLTRVRMFVDRVYLTAIFLGPWNVIRVVVPFALGVFFALKSLRVINPPAWVSTLGIAVLLVHAGHSIYLGRKLNARLSKVKACDGSASGSKP